jgi:hypothetical protein
MNSLLCGAYVHEPIQHLCIVWAGLVLLLCFFKGWLALKECFQKSDWNKKLHLALLTKTDIYLE